MKFQLFQYKRTIIQFRIDFAFGISSLMLVCYRHDMALDEKMGGPYTKQEQEIRRDKVFELYFEQRHSALQIAKILDINRNTINKDVKFWYEELRNEKPDYSRNWLDKQLARLEFQQSRLEKELGKEITLKERLQIEKSITHIDLGIASLIVKIETSRKYMKL